MRVPRATYRVQFSSAFTFAQAEGLIPYLVELGISDLYASPYMKARPGSTHGYDVVDYNALNPEIGSEREHGSMVGALHDHGMGQLLDIVPNHMGVGAHNAWWSDVLEHGPASPYARFFDIDWRAQNRMGLSGKVLLPVLGNHYRMVLEGGELVLAFYAEGGTFSVNYYEHRFPLDPKTYSKILGAALDEGSEHARALEGLARAFGDLPGRDAKDPREGDAGRLRDAAVHKAALAGLCAGSEEVAEAIGERVRRINGAQPGFEELHRLLEAQAYRLAYWRVASDEINYRRFFAINDLAGVRVEEDEVFRATHRSILELVGEGKVDGLRIDHPDGLFDPAGYLRRLQQAAARARDGREGLYVLVEKILAVHEDLPGDWPVAGTTGYEFTNLVNGLFVDPSGEAGMDEAYARFIGRTLDFEELLLECKHRIMRDSLASELDALSRRLLAIAEYGRRSYDFTLNGLRAALAAVVADFPVYRTYVVPGSVSEADGRYVEQAVSRARERNASTDKSAFDFIRDCLLLNVEGSRELRLMVVAFVMKFQQYTGPVMAKGMEDTALYLYNRLVSLNEVGGEPERFGVSVSEFHRLNAERSRRWPHSMLSTSTHDTKRSEDVRARINALSEMPGEWRERLLRWEELNRPHRRVVDGEPAPSPNDEYLLYQTLLGAWPLEELSSEGLASLRGRITSYMEKATRESQARTSWEDINEEYELAVTRFAEALLSSGDNPFLREFIPFQRRIARLGALNSLSQTLLKLTVPGVPDIYWGQEIWDFSLVDPDNRRPIDYGLRKRLLAHVGRMNPADARSLLYEGDWQDGRPKLYLTRKALELRRDMPDLFENAEYLPLETSGPRAAHLVAFARRLGEAAVIIVAPRLYAGLVDDGGPLITAPEVWDGTSVYLPDDLAGARYRNVLTAGEVGPEKRANGALLPAGELLRDFPVALLAVGDG